MCYHPQKPQQAVVEVVETVTSLPPQKGRRQSSRAISSLLLWWSCGMRRPSFPWTPQSSDLLLSGSPLERRAIPSRACSDRHRTARGQAEALVAAVVAALDLGTAPALVPAKAEGSAEGSIKLAEG